MVLLLFKFSLNRILETRKKTKYWLSKQTGIDNNTLAKIYNNEAKQIKLETLDKICTALECNLTDVIENVEDEKSYGE